MDLDELQEKLGGISYYQIGLIVVVSILPFGTAFMSQTAVFFSAVPSYRCLALPLDDASQYPELTNGEIKELITPEDDSCSRFNYNLSACSGNGSLSCLSEPANGTMPCDNGYYYDKTYYERTTVTEWNLVCGRVTLDSIAISLYFVGVLIGSGIMGPLMDWTGRRMCMVITCCGVIASGLAVTFSPSYEVYIAMRVLVGMTSISFYVTYYTYLNEISYTKWRIFVVVYANVVNGLSHTVLPILGMLIRDWRYLGLCVSLFPVPFLIIFFFIPESPRWLIGKRRPDEARAVVERYARSLKKTLEDEDWETVVKTECDKMDVSKGQIKYTVLDLYRLPLMRVVSVNTMYLWCVTSIVFYGLTLNVGRLSGQPHVNSILNASVEIIAYFVLWIMVRLSGMRISCSLSYSLSGICCLTTMLLTEFANGNKAMTEAARWIAIGGKLFATVAFGIIYQYTTELYPTLARGTAMSMGSMSARIGTIILPFTLQLQESIPWLTQTIFGVMGVIGGATSLLYPETSKSDLISTFEQAENFYRQEMRITASLLGKKEVYKESDIDDKKSTDDKSGYEFDYDTDELKPYTSKL